MGMETQMQGNKLDEGKENTNVFLEDSFLHNFFAGCLQYTKERSSWVMNQLKTVPPGLLSQLDYLV